MNEWTPDDRLVQLTDAACSGTIGPDDLSELQRRLGENPAVRGWYLDYFELHTELYWLIGRGQAAEGLEAVKDVALPVFVSCLSDLPTGTAGFFSSGLPLAYLLATVILGVGLWISSLIPAYQSVETAQNASPQQMGAPHAPETVGRITGMVDCKWRGSGFRVQGSEISKSPSLQISKSLVSFGDKFALASGLLEITYDRGAKVILQGPVSYETESNGGYLSVGKLTGKLETKAQDPRPKTPTPSSFILHPSSFVIRTPTATVTDLGTEFGVDVSPAGLTRVHVLQGVVEARSSGTGKVATRCQQVTAGHALEIVREGAEFQAVAFMPHSFVRTVRATADTPAETAYINAVLADGPLGYWPLNERHGARAFRDRSGNGFHGSAMSNVTAGQPGPLAGESGAVALDGGGNIDIGRHDEFALVDDFTVEAWVCTGKASTQTWYQVIAANPNVAPTDPRMVGWALHLSRAPAADGRSAAMMVSFCKFGTRASLSPIPLETAVQDHWLHVAVACDRGGMAHFYLNGQHQQSLKTPRPGSRGPVWIEIGGGPTFGEYWHGRLAHVAVYPRALNQQQIQNHYDQCGKGNAITP